MTQWFNPVIQPTSPMSPALAGGSFTTSTPMGSPLEWVAYPFSSVSSWPRNQTGVSCIAGRFFTNWAIREAPWKKSYDKPRQCIKKQRHHFADKCPSSQSCGFSGSHVQMWELDHKEDWGPKNWCFWILVLEKTLESLLDSREIKPVNPKGNQPWAFIGKTDAEA